MDQLTKMIKEDVLKNKEKWKKKSTKLDLNLWECANIHAALEITNMHLTDKEAIKEILSLIQKFKGLRFEIQQQI